MAKFSIKGASQAPGGPSPQATTLIKEVFIDRPVEVIREVEKIVERPVEIIKEVVVEKTVEVIREVRVEVPVERVLEVIKEVPKEVIREVEKIVEMPVEIIRLVDRKIHLVPSWAYAVMGVEAVAIMALIINKLL